MKELLYFEFADMMVMIQYNPKSNCLHYTSHRLPTPDERAAMESYILARIAPRTPFFQRQPAHFYYAGVEPRLASRLEAYRLLEAEGQDGDAVQESVQALISEAMHSYYFNKIGDVLRSLREALNNGQPESRVTSLKAELQEWLRAYNLHSNQNIRLEDILQDVQDNPAAPDSEVKVN